MRPPRLSHNDLLSLSLHRAMIADCLGVKGSDFDGGGDLIHGEEFGESKERGTHSGY